MRLTHPDDIIYSIFRMHPEDYKNMINDQRFITASKKSEFDFLEFKSGKFIFTINPTKNQIWINKGHYNSWGSPGSNFLEFLTELNKDYFIEKVFPHTEKFNLKKSLASFRKELNRILPSYISPKFAKEMRWEIRAASHNIYDEQSFVTTFQSIDIDINYSIHHKHNTNNLRDFDFEEYKWCFREPWHHIVKSNTKYVEDCWKAFEKVQQKIKVNLKTNVKYE